jgi:hypothetical protein
MTLRITTLCHNGECRILFIVMLNVIMLSVMGPAGPVMLLSVEQMGAKSSEATFSQMTFNQLTFGQMT